MIRARLEYNKDADLKKVGRHIIKEIPKMQRELLGETAITLMERTPVNTGRAAMGWSAGAELSNESAPSLSSPHLDALQMSKGQSESHVEEVGTSISLVNAVPYISEIEHGRGTKEPGGFIRTTVPDMVSKIPGRTGKIINLAFKAGRWGQK